MKSMSKKALMVCVIPAVLVGGAVMIYCFATNVGGDEPVLYAMAAGGIMFLLLYLLVGRRMRAKEDGSAAPSAAKGTLNLKDHLSPEEIRILLSDLQVAANRASGTQKTAYTSLAGEINRTGKIKAGQLSLCVSAVEGGLGVFSAFGLAPAGHSSLLDKLKKLDNEQ